MKHFLILSLAFFVAACQPESEAPPAEEAAPVVEAAPATEMDTAPSLADVLEAQDEDAKARYAFRNPKETIEFFGIEPGMTVLEGLPGGGWYTKILLPYLGPDGTLIGANYSAAMWSEFPFANEAFMERIGNWQTQFAADAQEWGGDGSASVAAYYFGSMPETVANSVDVAFFPRVLHNAARFQNEGRDNYLEEMLADVYTALKPGGVFGVVQHEARPEASDEFAQGGNGYLKKDWLVAQIEAAGFEFVAESDINANPKDQPAEDEVVWRLPPNYSGVGDDAELKAAMDEIGESNRMTLKFRKPT